MKNFYEILEVSENASQEVIEKAYKTLAKKYHPDIQPTDKLFWAESKLKELNEAYEILSNISSREKYDLKIGVSSNDEFNVYSENALLKQELEKEKIRNATNEYNNNKNINKKHSLGFNSISSYFEIIGDLISGEKHKPSDEKKRDLIALIITIIIMSIVIFLFVKIPFLNNLL